MSKDWDFYPLRVDDKPASIFVDLGVASTAPDAELPYMGYARLHMAKPRHDGLSSQEEYEVLIAVEDAMSEGLTSTVVAYVGRCTTNDCRDFYFYLQSPTGWEGRVGEVLKGFAGYRYETGTRHDPDWSSYFKFLAPGERDRQHIQNRRVCDTLNREGDALVAQRDVDHWSYFPSDAERAAFVVEAVGMGFGVRVLSETDDEPRRYCAQLWRRDVPSFEGIDGITWPLFEAARRHHGDYDGWECAVER